MDSMTIDPLFERLHASPTTNERIQMKVAVDLGDAAAQSPITSSYVHIFAL